MASAGERAREMQTERRLNKREVASEREEELNTRKRGRASEQANHRKQAISSLTPLASESQSEPRRREAKVPYMFTASSTVKITVKKRSSP